MSNPSVSSAPASAWAFGPDRDQLVMALTNAAIDAHQEAQRLVTSYFNGVVSILDFVVITAGLKDFAASCDDRADSLIPF